MELEHALLAVQRRWCLVSPAVRRAMEYASLCVAISCLCLLVFLHIRFIEKPSCSSHFERDDVAMADIVNIKIMWRNSHFWNEVISDLSSQASKIRNKIVSFSCRSGSPNSIITPDGYSFIERTEIPRTAQFLEFGCKNTQRGKSCRTDESEDDRCPPQMFIPFRRILDSTFHQLCSQLAGFRQAVVDHFSVKYLRWLKALITEDFLGFRSVLQPGDTLHVYSQQKGLLLLPPNSKLTQVLSIMNITISGTDACFGNKGFALFLALTGYDTVLLNSLLKSQGKGFLHNLESNEIYNLDRAKSIYMHPKSLTDQLMFKLGVIVSSLFVYFTTTMSVSFTLRETQLRMLQFTLQLQQSVRNGRPTFHLIAVHVIEILVFGPIMIGILFVLFEFFEDQMLAFLVLSLVWLCETFAMISAPESLQFLPVVFFLYFMAFHIYYFSFSFGFSYLAFLTMVLHLEHSVLYFLNHFELPPIDS